MLLLKHGCNVFRLDQSLENILHLAARNDNAEFIQQLFQVIPEMKVKALNVISLKLETPLEISISKYEFPHTLPLTQTNRVFKLIINLLVIC